MRPLRNVPARSADSGAHPRHPHLLIVEDDPSTCIFLEHVLRAWYRTDTVENVQAGIEKSDEHSYDGFLVDIGLRAADEDGIDMLEHLRADRQYADAPVIAITGHVLPGDREHFLETGFDAYLGKPFFKDDLLTMLDRFFNHRISDA